jgi:hypothetical protein
MGVGRLLVRDAGQQTVSSSKAVRYFLLCRNIYYLGAGNQEAVHEDVLQTEVFSFIAITRLNHSRGELSPHKIEGLQQKVVQSSGAPAMSVDEI